MFVIKRNGQKETVKFDKILKRIQRQSKDLKNVDEHYIAQKVIGGLFDGVTTIELDSLAIETSYSMSIKNPEYDKLALRLEITRLHKDTDSTFSNVINKLSYKKDSSGKDIQYISDDVIKFVKKHSHVLDSAIDYNRDFLFDYFGFKTLQKSYLQKVNDKIVERPQHLWMRVACGIHFDDIDACLNTYTMLSKLEATHATPTLFNSATVQNQLNSCYLISNKEDSITGIFDTLKEVAKISKSSGGIGFHIHDVRSKGSHIYGTGGTSNGIIPMLKVYNETARYVNQGGKRPGAFAAYLEPWHPDIEDFLNLRKNNGKEELRARDLNLALWTPDLFFSRVENDEEWSLMDPNISKGLSDVYGEEFNELYLKYESENKFIKKVKARDIWSKVLESCIETGQPYILAKDAGNKKSNQKNIGVIKSSNLCTEIFEVSTPEETAVCTLASISLPSCLSGKKNNLYFNHNKLQEITKTLVENLNKVIDIGYYPTEAAMRSNFRHRPIGLGVQGLADVFAKMKIPFESNEAKELNKYIFETIYYSALKTSLELAKKHGPYKTFAGSPASNGILQFDMWGVEPSMYDWDDLKSNIKEHGLRNSLLVAPMPTASTSQIMGNTECFEAITSNLYKRSTSSGEFIMINKYLVEDLIDLNLWTDNIRQKIIASEGSIQNIQEIPEKLKLLYKTVWEISQKTLIDLSADRGAFICQSQSLNLYFKEATFAKLTSAYFYAWKKGLKTIVYYTRTQNKGAQKFTVDRKIEEELKNKENEEGLSCSLDNPESCIMCSS